MPAIQPMAMAMPNCPLGFIVPSKRTQAQADAHERAMARMPKFSMPGYTDSPKGTKIMLTDYWKHPDCVADMGMPFTGFGQYTGACVGVSDGDAITTASCVQRVVGDNPTKASIAFWPFPYGRTRLAEGDHGQGEGAIDSVMGDTVVSEGFFDITQQGLPQFTKTGPDGFWLTKQLELTWSDGSRISQNWITLASKNAGTTKTVVTDVTGIRASIVNGYPILDGCDNYVGKGAIKGSGDSAYVVGHYDGAGGHSTCYLGIWVHPTDGWLYLYSNQWPTETYPVDPAGAGRCCVWVPESEVVKLFRTGGDKGETMSYSNVPGQPAQPRVIEWGNM